MLALVKKPRIELSLHGENVDELIEWISKKYDVNILSAIPGEHCLWVKEKELYGKQGQNLIE